MGRPLGSRNRLRQRVTSLSTGVGLGNPTIHIVGQAAAAPPEPKIPSIDVIIPTIVESKLSLISDKMGHARELFLTLPKATLGQFLPTIGEMRAALTDVSIEIETARQEMKMAAAEMVMPVTGVTQITGAPAVHLRRAHKFPGSDLIFMDTLNHPAVGRPLDIFTSPNDLPTQGYSNWPYRDQRCGMVIQNAMRGLSRIRNWHGFNGLNLGDGLDYQTKLFEAWKNGSGLNKWVVMPLVVLAGKDSSEGEKYFGGNLSDSIHEGEFENYESKYRIFAQTNFYASCTPHRSERGSGFKAVDINDGDIAWATFNDSEVRVRPCLARESIRTQWVP